MICFPCPRAGTLLAALAALASSGPLRAQECRAFGLFAAQYDGLARPVAAVALSGERFAILEADARLIRIMEAGELKSAFALDPALGWPAGYPRALALRGENRLVVVYPRAVAEIDLARPERPLSVLSFADADCSAVAVRGDELFVGDRFGRCVRVIGPDRVERARLVGPLRRPSAIAVAADGEVFVADEDLHAIVRFAADGAVRGLFGDRGAFPGLFNAPSGLTIVGDCLYVADELNHRIAIFDRGGAPTGQWGMHAVVPREGDGKIHYPTSIAIAADGASAIVVEPFEHRVQRFAVSTPEPLSRAAMPSREGVQSHFGSAVASDGDLLVLVEPESASLFVFDLRLDSPVHVATFGGIGLGRDKRGRITAVSVDATTQRIAVADPGVGDIALFGLARDRSAPMAMDPFMPRLVRSIDLMVWSDLAREAAGLVGEGPLEPVAFLRRGGALWALDARLGLLVGMDARLRPTAAIATGATGGRSAAAWPDEAATVAIALPDEGAIVVVDEQGREVGRYRGAEDRPFVRPTALARGPDGSLVVTDAGADRVFVLEPDGRERLSIGSRGGSDGEFWAPDGVAWLATGQFVVVDRGNHRAQRFAADGSWQMTFGLGRAYTRPRDRGAS
jgi:DNA-binding beta-propeller fold protein YncE